MCLINFLNINISTLANNLLILESKSSKKKRGNNNRKDDSDNESKQIVIAQVLCLFAYWLISCICIDPISTQINLIWEYKRT